MLDMASHVLSIAPIRGLPLRGSPVLRRSSCHFQGASGRAGADTGSGVAARCRAARCRASGAGSAARAD